MRTYITAMLLLGVRLLTGQDILSADSTVLFRLQDGRLLDARGNAVYTISGNIIFEGASRDNDRMLYLIRSSDIFSKEVGLVYNANLSQTLFSVYRGNMFSGDDLASEHLLLEAKVTGEEVLAYDYYGELRARWLLTNQTSGNTQMIAILIALVQTVSSDTLLRGKSPEILGEPAVMRPYWTNAYYSGYDEWEWDGYVLRPRYDYRPGHEWTFDGRYIRPVWRASLRDEWEWDGEILKRAWLGHEEFTYIWDGRTVRPFWNPRMESEWVIEQGRARPKWFSDLQQEWVIEGNMPVPLVIMVVLGFAYR